MGELHKHTESCPHARLLPAACNILDKILENRGCIRYLILVSWAAIRPKRYEQGLTSSCHEGCRLGHIVYKDANNNQVVQIEEMSEAYTPSGGQLV